MVQDCHKLSYMWERSAVEAEPAFIQVDKPLCERNTLIHKMLGNFV